MAIPLALSLTHPVFLFPIPTTLHRHTKQTTTTTLASIKNDTITPQNDTKTPPNDTKIPSLRVAFAAGGTGGHIFPAIAIAEELKLSVPTAEILFLGRPESMESSAASAAGFQFAPIPPAKLRRPKFSLRNLNLPFDLISSTLRSFEKLREFRPHAVVGTGGYVSFPTCLAAAILRFSGGDPVVAIQEQNSVPGIANLVLSRFADSVFVAFDSAVECFPEKGKCVVVGNPVRVPAEKSVVERDLAVERFFPGAAEMVVVLVLGGSLGANAVNIAMLNGYREMLGENERLLLIWQTGVQGFDEMESLVKPHPRLFLAPFIHSMDLAYRAADLVISRAGAMTCSEILAHGKPSILIPSPHVAEGHQYKNASLMADLADAKVITDDELDSTTLKIAVEELLGDKRKMAEMSEKARNAGNPNAAAEIVQHILLMVGASSTNSSDKDR